jgi:hypothetical protein
MVTGNRGYLKLIAAVRSSNAEIVNAFVKYYVKHNLNINIAGNIRGVTYNNM